MSAPATSPLGCALCSRTKHMKRRYTIYGARVCRRCMHGFANRRQLAFVLDYVALYVAVAVVGIPLVMFIALMPLSLEAMEMTGRIVFWALFPLLFLCKDGMAGYSPGKLICGVRVVNRDTYEPIGPMASCLRNLPLWIPFMIIWVAFRLMRGYRTGDRWSRSKVIWRKYAKHPVFTGLAVCENCQYDLTGNRSGTCPECGSVLRRDPQFCAPAAAT